MKLGSEGDITQDASLESGYTNLAGFSLDHFTGVDTLENKTGVPDAIHMDNLTRQWEIRNLDISGFTKGIVGDDVFDGTIDSVYIYRCDKSTIHLKGKINSIDINRSRLELVSNGPVLILEGAGGSRNIVIHRNEIQSSAGDGINVRGIKSFSATYNQFEGLDRNHSASNADIDIDDGAETITIENNYHTGAARMDTTNSRGIRIRNGILQDVHHLPRLQG